MNHTATYSPDDNKLRLYPAARLDAETYARVKAAGFSWAPKQELFVAGMWTPGREDLLVELCGEIGDEDSTLMDRAEARADRFEDYSDKREADAHRAKAAVDAIADGIPMGQPILVGHHSERRARKDAERIRSGMTRAVKLWETSQYWTDRAAGAISHAKYKERPDVRHRRIKTLQSDRRKVEKNKSEAAMWFKLWTECGNEADAELQKAVALKIANGCWLHLPRKEGDRPDFAHTPTAYDALNNSHPTLYAPRTVAEIVAHALATYPRTIANCDRWLAHYDNRLAYENAMLADAIGVEATDSNSGSAMSGRFPLQVGGKVLIGREWLTIMRINKSGGAVNSVTTNAPSGVTWTGSWKYGVEKISDYQAPTIAETEKMKAATALPPMCNYPGDGFHAITEAEWKRLYKDYKGSQHIAATETHAGHRVRHAIIGGKRGHVYITDAKRKDPPAPATPSEPSDAAEFVREYVAPPEPRPVRQAPERTAFDDMRDSLKHGVKVVSAPQLFPTPADLARRAVELAGVMPGERVLEPSAGTGAILRAIFGALTGADCGRVVAVERSVSLAQGLRDDRNKRVGANESNYDVRCTDFLECGEELGKFHRVVMNPPFENTSDIKHILHAFGMLKPGGRLVAICANGPRQNEKLRPLASHWEELPPGTFKESGTNVNTVLLAMDAPAAADSMVAA